VLQHWCPDYVDALAQEHQDRCSVLAGIQEVICGRRVVQLTPFIWDDLIASGSPYACGGKITPAAIIQFLWRIDSPGYERGEFSEWLEMEIVSKISLPKSAREISAYLDRTFMDSCDGEPCKPYYPMSIGLSYQMAKEPYKWPVEKTIHEPLRKLFLLLRPVQEASGVSLINKRSDLVELEAVAELDRRMAAKEITPEIISEINRPIGGK
jgi:hypothetical protein